MNGEYISLDTAKKLANKERVINILLSRIAKLEHEVERLENRNKEIYEGFMATTEELCEATKEIEKEKEHRKKEVDYWRIQYFDLQERINKAIEIIDIYGTSKYETADLLYSALRGSDKE